MSAKRKARGRPASLGTVVGQQPFVPGLYRMLASWPAFLAHVATVLRPHLHDAAVEALEKLGARIVRPALPHRFSDYAAATGRIIGAEGYRFVGHLVDDERLPVDPHVRPRIQIGRGLSARDYLLALAEREERRRVVTAALADVDALLTPTTQTPPIPIDQADQSGTAAHFTRAVNYLGLCALAVPDGFTAGGLPLSLQIICHAGEEAMALRIGWAYEQATDWKQRRPPEPATATA